MENLHKLLLLRRICLGKILANDVCFTKFAQSFPLPKFCGIQYFVKFNLLEVIISSHTVHACSYVCTAEQKSNVELAMHACTHH